MDIKILIKKAGGQVFVANIFGITKQAVSQWRKVPPERVLSIEKATNGEVTRHELRPDLYPLEESATPKLKTQG